MKNIVLVILFFAFGFSASGQEIWFDSLSRYSQKVYAAYHIYNKNRLSVIDMTYYLQVFPKTKDDFIFTFDPDERDYRQKELFRVANDYVDALEQIGKVMPDSVLKIGLGICKQMKWSYGVSEKFQHAILSVAANNPVLFVNYAYMLKRRDREKAMAYLADIESKPECAVYAKLIDALHEVGAYNLEGLLQRSRTFTH